MSGAQQWHAVQCNASGGAYFGQGGGSVSALNVDKRLRWNLVSVDASTSSPIQPRPSPPTHSPRSNPRLLRQQWTSPQGAAGITSAAFEHPFGCPHSQTTRHTYIPSHPSIHTHPHSHLNDTEDHSINNPFLQTGDHSIQPAHTYAPHIHLSGSTPTQSDQPLSHSSPQPNAHQQSVVSVGPGRSSHQSPPRLIQHQHPRFPHSGEPLNVGSSHSPVPSYPSTHRHQAHSSTSHDPPNHAQPSPSSHRGHYQQLRQYQPLQSAHDHSLNQSQAAHPSQPQQLSHANQCTYPSINPSLHPHPHPSSHPQARPQPQLSTQHQAPLSDRRLTSSHANHQSPPPATSSEAAVQPNPSTPTSHHDHMHSDPIVRGRVNPLNVVSGRHPAPQPDTHATSQQVVSPFSLFHILVCLRDRVASKGDKFRDLFPRDFHRSTGAPKDTITPSQLMEGTRRLGFSLTEHEFRSLLHLLGMEGVSDISLHLLMKALMSNQVQDVLNNVQWQHTHGRAGLDTFLQRNIQQTTIGYEHPSLHQRIYTQEDIATSTREAYEHESRKTRYVSKGGPTHTPTHVYVPTPEVKTEQAIGILQAKLNTSRTVRPVFDLCDVNRSGYLERSDLLEVFQRLGLSLNTEDVECLFQSFVSAPGSAPPPAETRPDAIDYYSFVHRLVPPPFTHPTMEDKLYRERLVEYSHMTPHPSATHSPHHGAFTQEFDESATGAEIFTAVLKRLEQEYHSLRDAFIHLDERRSGDVSVSDLQAALDRLGRSPEGSALDKMMAFLDEDGGGTVTYDEFISKAREAIEARGEVGEVAGGRTHVSLESRRERRKQVKQQNLREMQTGFTRRSEVDTFKLMFDRLNDPKFVHGLFQALDADGSGELDAQELMRALQTMGIFIDLPECEDMIKKLDDDASGTIDANEFLSYLQRVAAAGPEDESDPQGKRIIAALAVKAVQQGTRGWQ